METDRDHIGAEIFDRLLQLHFFLVEVIAELFSGSGGDFLCRDGAEYSAALACLDRQFNGFRSDLLGELFCRGKIFSGDLIRILLFQFQIIQIFCCRLDAKIFLKMKFLAYPSFTSTISSFFPRDFTSSNKITFILCHLLLSF